MKIVLSRKGFDTGSGGSFSPYNHESGKYISFPIPEKVGMYANKIRYSDIHVKDNYIEGLRGTNLSEVYRNWKGKDQVKLRQKAYASIHDKNLFAHVDPMLGMPPWLVENDDNGMIGKGFGQYNASPQLERHQVKEGSIF